MYNQIYLVPHNLNQMFFSFFLGVWSHSKNQETGENTTFIVESNPSFKKNVKTFKVLGKKRSESDYKRKKIEKSVNFFFGRNNLTENFQKRRRHHQTRREVVVALKALLSSHRPLQTRRKTTIWVDVPGQPHSLRATNNNHKT